MAYVLTDEQLYIICERSAGVCGNNGYDDKEEY